MRLTTNEQIARFLAEQVMGWEAQRIPPVGIFEKATFGFFDKDIEETITEWRPCSDLNQAFMVLLKHGFFRVGLGVVEIKAGDGMLWVDSGDTPAAIARAICVAVCRAHGAEVE